MGLPKLVLDGSLPEIHVSHFTPLVLRRFLERNGFKVVEDTLDRFYAESDGAKLKNDLSYHIGRVVKKLFGINIYPTILTIRKDDTLPAGRSRLKTGSTRVQLYTWTLRRKRSR